MRTNVMVRDLDMGVPLAGDARRLEVVVDGLPFFSGRQFAIDASVLHADRNAIPLSAIEDGVALVAARRRKERKLVRPGGRARLVVVVGEIGGRWSVETIVFVSQLVAKARSR